MVTDTLTYVERYAETTLPTEFGDFGLFVYRAGEKEHLAIVAGEVEGAEDLPVRVHSECLTSEVFGSLKCDCKAQLHGAMKSFQLWGRGIVIYLRQEGRGIGLGNKIRAYNLQASGADTVDANRMLGFGDDLRTYDVAAEMLRDLGVQSVQLLTNNPDKVDGLRGAGMTVTGRRPLVEGVTNVNLDYMQTKRDRMGHVLDQLGSDPANKDKVAG